MNRYKTCNRVSLLGVFGNLFLMIIKGIVGFISGSQSMLADFFNSSGDIISSLMTNIGNRISSKSADDDHNFGHGKVEYVYSLLISVLMISLAILTIKNALNTIFNHISVNYSIWLLIVCITTIVVKYALYLYSFRMYKKHKSILIKAMYKDHRNDCFISLGTLLSCICSYYKIFIVDGIFGIIISIWIGYSAIKLFKDSYDVLTDKSFDTDFKNKILNIIKEYKEVKNVNHFNCSPVGYRYQISFTIFVDGDLSTRDSHDIANKLEREIEKKVPEIFLTVIHVNPYDDKNV